MMIYLKSQMEKKCLPFMYFYELKSYNNGEERAYRKSKKARLCHL